MHPLDFSVFPLKKNGRGKECWLLRGDGYCSFALNTFVYETSAVFVIVFNKSYGIYDNLIKRYFWKFLISTRQFFPEILNLEITTAKNPKENF